MDLVNPILMGIIFLMYLIFFFKAVYPHQERSWVSKYFPFGLIVGCTGLFYGALIYVEVVLHRPFIPGVQFIILYVFLIVLVVLVHLFPMPFRGRVILYGLSWGFGIVAYCFLLVYIDCILWGIGSGALAIGSLIFGLFFPPMVIVGAWGLVHEDVALEYLNPSWRFWGWIGFTLLLFSLFTLAFFIALCYLPLLIVGILEGVGGGVLLGIMAYRLRRQRRGDYYF